MTSTRADVVSSFTIVKGALIPETYAAFQSWDSSRTVAENMKRIKQSNPIGAKSEYWLKYLMKVLHRRFDPDGRDQALVRLAQAGCDLQVWKPLLLWHMTRDEFLLRDFLLNWLFGQHEAGVQRIRANDIIPYLKSLSSKDVRVASQWSESTTKRVAAGLLKISADFGLLKGGNVREFAAYHLPEECFLYLLHAMRDQGQNASRVIDSPDWRMFLMSRSDVEQELYRLHQFRKLHYDAAGSLVQLQLPCLSAAEFAEKLVA